jgi:hypothetical protein
MRSSASGRAHIPQAAKGETFLLPGDMRLKVLAGSMRRIQTRCAIPRDPGRSAGRAQLADPSSHPLLDSEGLLFVLVVVTGPKEAPQPVFFSPRDHVHVQMSHALADLVIDGQKDTLGPHRFLNGSAQEPSLRKEMGNFLFRQILKGRVVAPGDKKAVAGKKRSAVQKSLAPIVLVDNPRWHGALNNLAERAAPLRAARGGEAFFHTVSCSIRI